MDKYLAGHLTGFSAGPKEKDFAQTYAPTLKLPVDERAFLSLLKSNKLDYEVRDERDGSACRYAPQWKLIKDDSIVKLYVITDTSRMTAKRGVHFAAFVNDRKQVVYVENRFTYEGP